MARKPVLGSIALVLALTGCAGYPTYERGLRVAYADDIGTVTISQSGGVYDWDEVATDLQPNFKMDSATALTVAMPTTQNLDQRFYDALTVNLQVGLPTTTTSQITKEVTDPETLKPVTSVDNTRTRQTGTPPPAAGLTPTGAAALVALTTPTLGDDPMLRYLAATAVQQEVALLNRYVRNQVRWPGSQAFVVRLQLTVMPNARTMPYDIETDITLHSEDEQSRAGLALSSQIPPNPGGDGMTPTMRPATAAIEERESRCAEGSYDTLQVLPMIVTDNLESMRSARTTDNVRQLALALLGTAGNVGASGQFSRTLEELQRAEGHDTNSLLTVAKLSDDTVRVRLGAVQSPRYGHVMTARNHFVSLVVVVKPCVAKDGKNYVDDGPRTITAVTRTAFRDGDTGSTVPYRQGTDRLMEQIKHIQREFVGQFTYVELARMFQWATRQDRASFFKYVVGQHLDANMCKPGILNTLSGISSAYKASPQDFEDLREPEDYMLSIETVERVPRKSEVKGTNIPNGFEKRDARCLSLAKMRYKMVAAPLWTELQSMRPTGQFAFTNIPITLRKRRPSLPPLQTALVTFNGTNGDGSVTLSQGRDMLELTDPQFQLVNDKGLIIPATNTVFAANGKSVTGTFPPLGRFGVKVLPPETPERVAAAPAAKAKAGAKAKKAPPTAHPQPETAPPAYWLKLTVGATSNCPADSTPVTTNPLTCQGVYSVRLFDSAKVTATSPFSLAATSKVIAAEPPRNTATFIVSIVGAKGAKSDKLRLSLNGAQIAAAHKRNGTALTQDGMSWIVDGPGDIVLDLTGIAANVPVEVSLKDGAIDAGTLFASANVSAPVKP